MTKHLYVPESFDPHILADKWSDYAAYVLSIINQRLVFEKLDPDAFAPLMSVLLKRVLPKRHYKIILDLLMRLDVIECDNRYSPGTKSKGYRLTARYRGEKHRRYLVTHPGLTAKLDQLKREMHDGIILPVHRYLYRWLQEITFEYPGDIRNFGRYFQQVDEIINKNFRFSTAYEGRVDTNLTNLKSELRTYLTFRGKELSTIDISNSQPLFLGVLCLNRLINNGFMQTAFKFKASKLHFANTNLKAEEEGHSIMWEHTLGVPNNLQNYLKLCTAGKIYEHLMQRTGKDRQMVKKAFFQVLFSSNRIERLISLTPVLEQEFPTIMEAVRGMKQKDYKQASALLTRTESDFVINRVCRRLMNDHPSTFVSTIHDCLMTTTEDVPTVKAVILDEFERLCGLQPALKIERLRPPEQVLAA